MKDHEMDVWVVAAAASAGYVAQRLKNIVRGRHDSSGLSAGAINYVEPESPRIIGKVQDKSCLFGKAQPSKSYEEEVCVERAQPSENSTAIMASNGGLAEEYLVTLNHFASFSGVSNVNSLPGLLGNEAIRRDMEGRLPCDIDEVINIDSVPQPSSSKTGFLYGSRRISSLRSRKIQNQFIKPQTSLESCLMAQLYDRYAEIEEYTYSVHSAQQQSTVRPFFVTDGSRIINGPPHESFSEPAGITKYKLQEAHVEEKKTVYGVPKLHNTVEFQKKAKAKTEKEKILTRSNYRKAFNGNNLYSQGSNNGSLFCLGLTMGIICSFLANKWEMEKLNRLLKQTENLVQDLQEELEMKDSLTVKELAIEDYDLQDMHQNSHFNGVAYASSHEPKSRYSSRCGDEECSGQKAKDESLSQIEAELEAELERLESNINSSRLAGKLSDMSEGELRADLFGGKNGSQPCADRDESRCSTPPSAHYPVSPRELSLKLHEVIQLRLEERVKELETELENSQRMIKESKHIHPREVPNCQNSLVTREEQACHDQPIVINLSGDSLSAYNEAYEEFTKASETDEEDLPFGFGFEKNDHQEIFHQCKQVIDQVQDGGLYCFREHRLLSDRTPKTVYDCPQNGHHRDILPNEESEDVDDEMERLLIRQIVEKAKQGSPAVLNAQKTLLFTDEN